MGCAANAGALVCYEVAERSAIGFNGDCMALRAEAQLMANAQACSQLTCPVTAMQALLVKAFCPRCPGSMTVASSSVGLGCKSCDVKAMR